MLANRFSLALALLMACSATVACGGGGSGDTGTPTVPTGGDPTTPGPSGAASININRGNVQFTSVGETQALGAEVRNAAGSVLPSAPITWSSAASGIVSISSSGVATAVARGTTLITATSGSVSATVTAVVGQTPASINISPSTIAFASVGGTQQLNATVLDASRNQIAGAPIVWSVTPTSVASVSSTGLVTALAAGAATVTASVQGLTANANVSVQSGVPNVCTERPVFSEYLIDPSLLKVVTQIGVIGGGNTELVGRSYAFAVDGMDGVKMALNAPTTLNVIAAKHYLPPGAPTTGYVPDWSLVLDVGCGITLDLYHVKDVAASIKAAVDTTISNSSAWEPIRTPVAFRAGETFGWYQRGLNSVAFDVIATDKNARNRFANQARYENGGSNILNIICPWTLFAPAKRDAYLGVIGAQTGVRFPGASCGTVERDVAGTVAGQWFRSETIANSFQLAKDGNYGNPMPIVLGIDSTVYVGHTGPSNDIRIDKRNATWKDPATIRTTHCYQIMNGSTSNGWLYFRMNSTTQMDVTYESTGTCPSAFPSSGFKSYYR